MYFCSASVSTLTIVALIGDVGKTGIATATSCEAILPHLVKAYRLEQYRIQSGCPDKSLESASQEHSLKRYFRGIYALLSRVPKRTRWGYLHLHVTTDQLRLDWKDH